VLVVGAPEPGAQSNLPATTVTDRLPNWSLSANVGKVAFGHFIL
jgi:hypothetical protein